MLRFFFCHLSHAIVRETVLMCLKEECCKRSTKFVHHTSDSYGWGYISFAHYLLYFLLFLHFHSCFSFFPVPLFHLFYSLFYLFSPFLWEMTQNDPQNDVSLNPNTINQFLGYLPYLSLRDDTKWHTRVDVSLNKMKQKFDWIFHLD